MSNRTIVFVIVLPLLFILINSWPVSRTLTEHECRTAFASNIVNEQLRALLLCPTILRPHKSPPKHSIAKRSVEEIIDGKNELLDEELDDFYVFW